ncbi:1,2-phenylacetyl-CoA epoxidase subunit B [Peribacillus muralis]
MGTRSFSAKGHVRRGKDDLVTRQETYFEEFEVFSRKTQSSPVQYQFSLLAPNEDIAIMMAQENFMRREAVDDIWVVKRQNIRKMTIEEKKTLQRMDNKDYRTTKGYGYLKKKWRKYEQGMLDEKEIMSWGGGVKNEE